jgi:hypothetical protein
MTEWVLVGAAGVVFFQILLGIFVHIDANRRDLDYLGLYFYGVSMPLVGLLIAGAYFSQRDELPTQDLSVPTAAEADGAVTWTVEHRGLRRLPLRLACVIQYGQTLWRVGVVTLLFLFALAVAVHPVIAIAVSTVWQLYFFFSLNGANLFTDTTIRLVPNDRRIEITTRGGDHPLSFGGGQSEIDLTEVQQAVLIRVADQPLVKFQYEHPFSVSPPMIPASTAHVEDIRQTLAAQEIPLHDRVRDGTNSRIVRRRIIVAVCSLVAVPLVAAPWWTEYFMAGPIVPFLFFVFLWVVLKPFA